MGREEETEIFAKKVRLFRQGKISDDDFRRFRLEHGAYGSRLRMDYSMVRIKVPSGEITPEQLDKIASLSEAFSIGSAHVSTRQNIHLHWVQLEDVSEVMRGLVEVGLTTREACGNSVRNVMCSHFAGVCPSEEFDATPYAKAIARFLLRNPMCQNLPRKFKINFSCAIAMVWSGWQTLDLCLQSNHRLRQLKMVKKSEDSRFILWWPGGCLFYRAFA